MIEKLKAVQKNYVTSDNDIHLVVDCSKDQVSKGYTQRVSIVRSFASFNNFYTTQQGIYFILVWISIHTLYI